MVARTFTAKYRDGSRIVREVSTGCRDETAERRVLADLERRAELVKAGVMSAGEDSVADHQATPLAAHIDSYLLKLESEGTSPRHRANVRRCLNRLAADCGFKRLADLRRELLERWMVSQAEAGMGARTRNTYRAAAVASCNWCIGSEPPRLLSNPFAKVVGTAGLWWSKRLDHKANGSGKLTAVENWMVMPRQSLRSVWSALMLQRV